MPMIVPDIIIQLISKRRGSRLGHKHIFSLCCVTLLFAGCSETAESARRPIGVRISHEQAQKISSEKYQVSKMNKVEHRHLSEEEMKLVPEEAKNKTPIYYVVSGSYKSAKKSLCMYLRTMKVITLVVNKVTL